MWTSVGRGFGVDMSHIPYGYKIVDARAVLDEETSKKVKMLFNEYLKLGSIQAANRVVGIDKKHSVIGSILKNKIYLGTDFYPRLIDNETFQKVQKRRGQRTKMLGRVHKHKKTKEVQQKSFHYEISKVEKRFQDPYEQAKYAYSQIKEIPDAK